MQPNPEAGPDHGEAAEPGGGRSGRRRRAAGTGSRRLPPGRPGLRSGRLGGLLIGVLVLGLLLCLGLGAGVLGTTNLGAFGGLGGLARQANADAVVACSPANPTDPACRSLRTVNSIQAYWKTALPQVFAVPYQTATTRFFSSPVNTACGTAQPGTGSFYCSLDETVYVDLASYPAGDPLAQAYLLAHEYGHHVQNLLGTEAAVRRAQQRDPGNANTLGTALELQADCYAGVWAFHAGETSDAGTTAVGNPSPDDIDRALRAAAVTDTPRPRYEQGLTQASTDQRKQWFTTGSSTGDPKQCTTFGANPPT